MKKVKTKFSKRGITISKYLAAELEARYDEIQLEKALLKGDYNDYSLVFAFDNTDPVEPHRREKWFKLWQKDSGLDLPFIMFRGLRHASTTYRLEISHGDAKSVQRHWSFDWANGIGYLWP